MPRRSFVLFTLASWVAACTPDDVAIGGSSTGDASGSSGGAGWGPSSDSGADGHSSTTPTSVDGGSSDTGASSGVGETTSGTSSSSTDDSGPATTGASTGDGSGTTAATSSSGDTTGTAGSSGDGGTTDASAGTSGGFGSSGGSTGGDTQGGGGPCEATIARTHVDRVATAHGGNRFVTVDQAHNLVLWDTATLEVLFEARRVDSAALGGDTLAFEDIDDHDLVIVDASSGTPVGAIASASTWGVAQGGSYVWNADSTAFDVHEVDGSLRWSIADAFGGVQVLALPDALHVFAPQQNPAEVLHLSADAGVVDSDAFAGSFGGWFGDAPRYWTTQGMAYRVYDLDNAMLVLDLGYPSHGWGTRLVVEGAVIDILDPDSVLATIGGERFESGAAVLWRAGDGAATLIQLDTDPVTEAPIAPGCCIADEFPIFSYAQGHWLLSGAHGEVTDELDRAITAGQVDAIAGSTAGRMALAMHDGVLHVADIGEDCGWDEISSFARSGRELRMSGDGMTLLSTERWTPMYGSNREGTRIYDLPDGAMLEELSLSVMSDVMQGHDIADDGSVWSRNWNNTGLGSYAVAGAVTMSGFGFRTPLVAPDAQHLVISDGGMAPFPTWADSVTYFYDPENFAGIIDGVAHGFIDDTHVLVAHYDDCGGGCVTMTSSDIVDMTGTVVATTTLPDLRGLRRIDDGAAVAFDAAGNGGIYDVNASTLLWQAPPGAAVEVAGANHVLVSTGARVDIVRWR